LRILPVVCGFLLVSHSVDQAIRIVRVRLLFAAASSDDLLTDHEETVRLTLFTPLISFLVVLISLLALLALIAFFTDTGNTNANTMT